MASIRLETNPILVKELRSRMRGGRAFAVLTITLVILGAFSYALYRMILPTANYGPTPISPQLGQIMFAGLALIELLMIVGEESSQLIPPPFVEEAKLAAIMQLAMVGEEEEQ